MKPRTQPDSLALLPRAQQREVAAWIDEFGLEPAVRLVAEKLQLCVSAQELSEFLSAYHVLDHLQEAARVASHVEASLASLPASTLDGDVIDRSAQTAFEWLAFKDKDARLFVQLRRLRQKDLSLSHDLRKVAVLEARAAQALAAERTARDPELTDAEKLDHMKRIFGLYS